MLLSALACFYLLLEINELPTQVLFVLSAKILGAVLVLSDVCFVRHCKALMWQGNLFNTVALAVALHTY